MGESNVATVVKKKIKEMQTELEKLQFDVITEDEILRQETALREKVWMITVDSYISRNVIYYYYDSQLKQIQCTSVFNLWSLLTLAAAIRILKSYDISIIFRNYLCITIHYILNI